MVHKKKFLLKKQNSFILILLLNYYLKNSLKFKLVLDVFYQRFETLEDTADIHFVSVSTLRRELDDLKTILTGFNLTLSGTTKLRVTGKEEHIRLFYTYFFSQGYQAESWPHECFSFQKIQKIEKLFPKSLCPTGDINSQIFLAHSFAVAFTRFKQGFLIDENTLSAPLFMNYLNPEFNREHAILLEAISLLIGPNINPKQVETELKFVYSLLFCHLEYHDKHDIYPDFFMLHPRFIESTFTEKVTRDTFSLLKWLEIPPTKTTFADTIYKITTLHYRIALFGKPFASTLNHLRIGSDQCISPDSYFHYIYYVLQKKMTLSDYQDTPWLVDYYIKTYSTIGSHLLANNFPRHEMNVLLIANQADYQYIIDTLAFLPMEPYLKVNFVSLDQNHLIDVVVSDIAISFETLQLSETIPVIYFEATCHDFSVKNIINKLVELHWRESPIF